MTDPVTLKEALDAFESAVTPEGMYGYQQDAVIAALREYLAFLEGPTDEDVEIAAKAIYEDGLTDEQPKWTDQDEEAKGWYRASARAVLVAVRDRSTG